MADRLKVEMKNIESKVNSFMEWSIQRIRAKLNTFKNVISPLMSDLVRSIPLHEDELQNNNIVIKSGMMNMNLCINAQTNVPHTERDSSYTIVSVPSQSLSGKSNKKNNTSFEFYMNEDKVIVVPMSIGTIICYSGYLLTHRQHKKQDDKDMEPFINMVSYNSKRLLSHMLSSIERNIEDNKKIT